MKLIGSLIHWLGVFCLGASAATVATQAVGLGTLSSRGMLTSGKMVKYAGVLYGLDPLDLSPAKNAEPEEKEEITRQKMLADRLSKTPAIASRQSAIRKGTDDIRSVVLGLKIKRERQQQARSAFESKLTQLEQENRRIGLREIEITLEALPAEQAKDILCTMLASPSEDPGDEVMADVVSIVRSMPSDKLRKVLEEFRSPKERELLHEILVRLGNLDKNDTQLTGTQP